MLQHLSKVKTILFLRGVQEPLRPTNGHRGQNFLLYGINEWSKSTFVSENIDFLPDKTDYLPLTCACVASQHVKLK